MALGHSLKTIGRQKEAIESYQTAAAVRPSFGDAYWSLANLKTYRFSQDEIARMRAEEASPSVQTVDRYHLCFALGKAYEDRNEYAESWQFYERGNSTQARRKPLPSGHHRNQHAQADRSVHGAVLRRARRSRRAGP